MASSRFTIISFTNQKNLAQTTQNNHQATLALSFPSRLRLFVDMLETEKKLQHEKQRWNNMHACLQYINACMIESQALAFVGRAPAEELKAELGNRTSNETSYSYILNQISKCNHAWFAKMELHLPKTQVGIKALKSHPCMNCFFSRQRPRNLEISHHHDSKCMFSRTWNN